MIAPYESTALLVVAVALVVDHGIGLHRGAAADVLVAAVGAATYVEGVDLSTPVAALWLVAAAVAGDQVARLGGSAPRRDPLGLLAQTHTAGAYAVASLLTAATWTLGLVLTGWTAACVVLS
ncbi:hypothetical protein GCM10023350_06160 [Nocardioides endophyticus]|uniref:Uncharacterized protein n=1 Tax=Nocardioides endophyticus TaxID=1353775 RepID=A0ABP8YBX1_9ACTN